MRCSSSCQPAVGLCVLCSAMQRWWLCCAALARCAVRTEVLTSSAGLHGEPECATEVIHSTRKFLCVYLKYFHGFALCSANMSKAAGISGTVVLGWRDVAHLCVTDFTRNNSGSFLKKALIPDVLEPFSSNCCLTTA